MKQKKGGAFYGLIVTFSRFGVLRHNILTHQLLASNTAPFGMKDYILDFTTNINICRNPQSCRSRTQEKVTGDEVLPVLGQQPPQPNSLYVSALLIQIPRLVDKCQTRHWMTCIVVASRLDETQEDTRMISLVTLHLIILLTSPVHGKRLECGIDPTPTISVSHGHLKTEPWRRILVTLFQNINCHSAKSM